jgi:hypothetical protein
MPDFFSRFPDVETAGEIQRAGVEQIEYTEYGLIFRYVAGKNQESRVQ